MKWIITILNGEIVHMNQVPVHTNMYVNAVGFFNPIHAFFYFSYEINSHNIVLIVQA